MPRFSLAQALKRSVRTLHLVYDEAAMLERRAQARGFMTLNQVERCTCPGCVPPQLGHVSPIARYTIIGGVSTL